MKIMTSHSQSFILISEVLNKNFENLRNLLVEINFCFKVICITESWCSIICTPTVGINFQTTQDQKNIIPLFPEIRVTRKIFTRAAVNIFFQSI